MNGPKILVLDIENSPILAHVWGLWNNDVGLNQVMSDWFIMTWAAKWLNEPAIMGDSLVHYPNLYATDPENDYRILVTLAALLDEADIVVGHNSSRFDVPKIRARMLYHGIPQPTPFKQMDTLTIAKNKFRFTSNKLQYIADLLGVGTKMDTGGHKLWAGCLKGDMESWRKMLEYNKEDVRLTEAVFKILAPHATNGPNFGLYRPDDLPRCTNPACGSTNVIRKGYDYTSVSTFRRWKCNDCGKAMRERRNAVKRPNLLTHVS